jgi:hypothetical protein
VLMAGETSIVATALTAVTLAPEVAEAALARAPRPQSGGLVARGHQMRICSLDATLGQPLEPLCSVCTTVVYPYRRAVCRASSDIAAASLEFAGHPLALRLPWRSCLPAQLPAPLSRARQGHGLCPQIGSHGQPLASVPQRWSAGVQQTGAHERASSVAPRHAALAAVWLAQLHAPCPPAVASASLHVLVEHGQYGRVCQTPVLMVRLPGQLRARPSGTSLGRHSGPLLPTSFPSCPT